MIVSSGSTATQLTVSCNSKTRNLLIDVLEDLPFPKQIVSLVLCQNTFEHLSNIAK